MVGPQETTRLGQILAMLALVGIFLVALESKDLHSMFPRALSLSIAVVRATPPSDTLSNTTLSKDQKLYAQSIPCALPIPSFTDEDESGTQSNSNNIDATCVKFFPERFFATVAADFRLPYQESKQVKTEHPVVHMTLQNSSALSSGDQYHYPSTVTYFHIRKCGGTTMFRSVSTRSLQIPYKANNYNRNMIESQGIVQDIYDRQQHHHDGEAVVFSFVRDPVIRFLSSVGQMLHMGKVKMFPECANSNLSRIEQVFATRESNTTVAKSRALVHCMLESIKSTQAPTLTNINIDGNSETSPQPSQEQQQQQQSYNFIDQHLLPQAFELRARSLEYDIGIHLMGMSQIAPTLKTMVGAEKQNRHARSSRVADYTQGYFLEASILTDAMIQDICRIYAVDILLLKTSGMSSSLCDTYSAYDSSLSTPTVES